LLWSCDSDGYLPYEEDVGLLAALTAFCSPDWFAISPICSGSFSDPDGVPVFFIPLWEIGP
jgi:hypothetical protein